MDDREVIRSQYQAALEMLKQTIAKCPKSIWDDPNDTTKFWHIAYHALFFAHLYLQGSEKEFQPWDRHREEYQFLGPLPWPPHRLPQIGDAFSKEDVLAYLAVCQQQVDEQTKKLDPQAESGFPWLPFSKLELQLYNIRHIQQHAGELMERLGARARIDIDWVAMKRD